MATSEADADTQHDDGHVTAQQWKWGVLAGMASYLDAGSIVALAAGLALWQEYLNMSSTTVGLLTLFGYFETDDIEKTREYLANDETNRRWSEWMDPILKVDIDPTTDFPYLLPLQWHMD